jgi:hypothetical protein
METTGTLNKAKLCLYICQLFLDGVLFSDPKRNPISKSSISNGSKGTIDAAVAKDEVPVHRSFKLIPRPKMRVKILSELLMIELRPRFFFKISC